MCLPLRSITRSNVLEMLFGAWSKCGVSNDSEIPLQVSRVPCGVHTLQGYLPNLKNRFGNIQLWGLSTVGILLYITYSDAGFSTMNQPPRWNVLI